MLKNIPQFEPLIKLKYIYSVAKTLFKGNIGPGAVTEKCEELLCFFTGSKHCLMTTSGTTALIMAIKSLNIPKDKVILLPAYTFIAPHNAARFLDYNIKLVDINDITLSMDKYELFRTISEIGSDNVGAVIFVTHNSCSLHLDSIEEYCRRLNIPLIVDSSQSLGNGKAFRDINVLSFSVPKIVSSGQGGAVLVNDIDLYHELKKIRDHGDNWRKSKRHLFLGVNFRFNDILASYLLPQLKDLNKLLRRREKIFNEYRRYLDYKNIIDFCYRSAWMLIYRTPYAREIIEALKKDGIQAVRYYKPINHNPPYKDDHIYPVAEQIYKECLYLPSSLTLKKRDIYRICNIIIATEIEMRSLS